MLANRWPVKRLKRASPGATTEGRPDRGDPRKSFRMPVVQGEELWWVVTPGRRPGACAARPASFATRITSRSPGSCRDGLFFRRDCEDWNAPFESLLSESNTPASGVHGSWITGGASATESELNDFCRENLAHYKCPKRVDFIDVLPRTATGKIQKNVLRERFWKGKTKQVG